MKNINYCAERIKKEVLFRKNPYNNYPRVSNNSFVDSSAIIIGNVQVGSNVYIGPNAVIRADEPGSSIIIKDNCNIQDSVIIHSLSNSRVFVDKCSSLSHGSVIHGPCKISKNCFVGFNSIVFNAVIGADVFIKHLAVVENTKVPPKRVVLSGSVINLQSDVKKLKMVDKELLRFVKNVVNVNIRLAKDYKRL